MKHALFSGISSSESAKVALNAFTALPPERYSLSECAEAALLAFAVLPPEHHPYIDFDEDRDIFWMHIKGLSVLVVDGLVERGPLVWRTDPVRAHARCLVLTDKGREALAKMGIT